MRGILCSIATIFIMCWVFGGGCSCSDNHKSDSDWYAEMEQRRIADSIARVEEKIKDSLELVAIRPVLTEKYGKNVSSIETAFSKKGCKYCAKTLKQYCEYSRDYTLPFVVWCIDSFGYEYSGRIDAIYELQKKYGRTKTLKAIRIANGPTDAGTILSGKVRVGFTKEMCRFAWGSPYDINRTTTAYGTHEQWCYSGYNYLYFDGNTLTSIQN